jgi:hypothetical protein
MNRIKNLINIFLVFSIMTWLITGALNSIFNIWTEPIQGLTNAGTIGFITMLSLGVVNFLVYGDKKNVFKGRPKVKTGCSSCKKKKSS